MRRVVAGIGCRAACPAEDIVVLVREAERRAARRVDALAAPAFKRHEPGLSEAAATLGLPLDFVPEDALLAVQDLCPSPSPVALRHTGIAAVAEGCALAGGGWLVLGRISHGGATCAVAEESGSFLKKRTKKLLRLGRDSPATPRQRRKSFLLLFFKKEGLSP